MKAQKKPSLPTFKYQARSGEYVHKTKDWFWILWIAALASVCAAILVGNYTFAAFLFLSGFVITILAIRKPPIVNVYFGNSYVQVQNKKYAVSEIESYNLISEHHRILLKHKKTFMPILVIPIGTRGPEGKIRRYLNESPWAEDVELQEPFLEVLAERLGI